MSRPSFKPIELFETLSAVNDVKQEHSIKLLISV
jgi:hypothetical protein